MAGRIFMLVCVYYRSDHLWSTTITLYIFPIVSLDITEEGIVSSSGVEFTMSITQHSSTQSIMQMIFGMSTLKVTWS